MSLRLVLLAVLALLALGLALGAWQTRRLAAAAEARFPPLGARAEAGGTLWHFTDRGSGPAIVLLHGAGANLRDFEFSLVPPLSREYRVLNFDRPGAGYSRAPADWMNPAQQASALLEILAQRGVEQAVWVGHSWAGAVVMAGLLAAPRRVAGGLLLAGAAYPWSGGVDLLDRLPGWPVVGPLATRTVIAPLGSLLKERGVASVFDPDPLQPEYLEEAGVELYLRPGQFSATARDVRLLSDYLLGQSPRYASIGQPLTVVHGTADTIVPAWNHADRLERLLPQARIVRLAGTGHQPHHVARAQVVQEIRRLVSRVFQTRDAGPPTFHRDADDET